MTDATGTGPVGDVGDVGSVGEEAEKLLHALRGLAKDVNQHVATGGTECRYCPLCRAVATVRGTSPEVKEHLSAAATSLMQAVAAVMSPAVPDAPPGSGSTSGDQGGGGSVASEQEVP